LDKLQDVGNFKQHVNRERHSSLIAAWKDSIVVI
jgi:hypothetical protein